MYIGGVGGMGKSHLIRAVVTLFERLGRRSELQLSAPTGAAGVMIEGSTIHSLTLLPNKTNPNGENLVGIWNNVTFLIIDEISMISAAFLADISERINMGKGVEMSSHDLPFGRINVLFTGDFGQLKPVMESCLYSHKLVDQIDI
jgi:ATP-dependent DNA helicase PIF1